MFRRVRTYRLTFRRNGEVLSKSHCWYVCTQQKSVKRSLPKLHIASRLGCFYVHGILQKYRGQAVKDTVFAAAVCKKCSAEQLHADGLTMGKCADIFTLVSRGRRSDRTPPRESPRRAHGTLQPVWMKV